MGTAATHEVLLLEALLALAEQVGLRVDRLGPGSLEQSPLEQGALEHPAGSGRCRLRGETWVLLAPGDPARRWIEVLGEGLREVAGAELEERYLTPAVREALFPEG